VTVLKNFGLNFITAALFSEICFLSFQKMYANGNGKICGNATENMYKVRKGVVVIMAGSLLCPGNMKKEHGIPTIFHAYQGTDEQQFHGFRNL
jgi:hypothetical protein